VWLTYLQLSRYCDDLLRNHAKGFSETEIDDRLNQVIVLFKYIEDKDLFERVGIRRYDCVFFFCFMREVNCVAVCLPLSELYSGFIA
jgi:hypothetical protein